MLRRRVGWVVLILSSIAVLRPGPAPARSKPPRQVLFFTKSSGFEHPVIKIADGQPSLAETIVRELGAANGFIVTHTKDGGVFTSEGLAKFDVLLLYTSGDLEQPGRDGNPPLPPGGQQLLVDWIARGRAGLVGLHAASDTFQSNPDRFADDGAAASPFIKMLGGEFIKHGAQQPARVVCVDARFPGMAACKDGFTIQEEWYSFKNLAGDLRVLHWLATWTLKNTGDDSVYRRAPYPITWARRHGKGRVFYSALGHREDVWRSALFQDMVVGALRWAAGDARADVTPNVSKVTPGYREIPPRS